MTKAKGQEHLAGAEEFLKKATARIREQEERVLKLAGNGHKTENSEETLRRFKDLEVTMVKLRAFIREELNRAEFR